MPIDYQIDRARRLILTRAWGTLTDGDILSLKAKLLSDPEFDPDMPELSDVSAIEQLEVTAAGVRAMVAHDSQNAARRSGFRLALVVPADEAFGMARMYQMMGDRQDHTVGVFRSRAEAEVWLANGAAR